MQPKGLAAAFAVQEAALAEARKEKGRKAVKERALMRMLSGMFADMHEDPAMWGEVKGRLNDLAVFIDLSRFGQITALRLAYDQVEIARATECDEDLAARGELRVGKESVKEPNQRVPRQRHCTSKVKVPFGGPSAAIILARETGDPQLCDRFHAKPKGRCTAGVPPGHGGGKEGQCAFKH